MQDIFVEYMVVKKKSPLIYLLTVLLVVVAIVVAVLAMVLSSALGQAFSMFGPLLAVGAIFGAYYLITSQNIEFEYLITNGEMDVDKIVAQRKRRRLITVNMRQVEAFGRYQEQEHAGKSYQTRLVACDSLASDDLWYCVSRQKEKGQTLVVFNASERMLNAVKPFLPKPIMHEVFRVK
ncbi:MAG: hypothetical protein ACK5LX_02020 [Oscillospiraceae bacterium]